MSMAPKPSPLRGHLLFGFGAAAVATWLGGALAGWPTAVMAWALLWLAAINLVAFAYYGFDKAQAGRQARRVPEAALHAFALAGGTLGAYAGMRLFRHKTLKGPFRYVFWAIAAAQALLLAGLVKWLWFS